MSRQSFALGYAGYILVGVGSALIPSLMPSIAAEFTAVGLTLTAMGLLAPAASTGRIVGTLLAGFGSDRLGRQRLVWLTALLLAAALALTAGARLWALFVLGYAVVGLVQGALSTSINAMVADAAAQRRARALNLLHGVYGAGAAISPLIIGVLLATGAPWRWLLAGTGALWLAYGLAATPAARAEATRSGGAATVQRERNRPADTLALFRRGPFLALFAIAFIYNGVATSMLNWVAIFTQDSAGLSAFGSVSMVAVFYVALTLGRFGCAALAERLGYAQTLLLLALGLLFAYPPVVLGRQALPVTLGVFGTGLTLSGLFPTVLADGARRYPAQTGMVTGTLTVALTLGSMLPPLWTGILADLVGLQIALGINYGMALVLLALTQYLRKRQVVTNKAA